MIEPDRLRDSFWRQPWSSLRAPVDELAERRGENVYAVGGFVRDLLIARPPADLDLVVEGDGLGFSEELARRLGVPVRKSPRFLSAELELPSLGRVDVSTARRETYAAPGELPRVEPADLAGDLDRRDFTVNTFALGLAGDVPREALSHPLALGDLQARLIRVLHPRSFVDDPTRLLRGVELEVRLGGRMEPETEALARTAVAEGALATVSGQRLWAALVLSLGEPEATARVIGRWRELGLLERLLPVSTSAATAADLVAASLDTARRLWESSSASAEEEASAPFVATTLLALTWKVPEHELVGWVERFAPPRQIRRQLLAAPERLPAALALLGSEEVRPSSDHAVLGKLGLPELALLGGLAGPRGSERVVREVRESRRHRLGVSAQDLIDRGATPGPAIGEALERTLAARLDGIIDREGELDYALQELAGLGGPGASPESSGRSDR